MGYRPEAARYGNASSGLKSAAAAVQDERLALLAGVASPGRAANQQFISARAALARADNQVLRSGVSGRDVLQDLVTVTATEQAWSAWAVQAMQEGATGGQVSLPQGDTLYAAYRQASGRAISDVAHHYADAVANERTVVLLWLILDGGLVIVAGALVWWTRRRVSGATTAAVDSLLHSVRRIEAGEVLDLRDLEPPAELAELSRVIVGLALELDSVRGAVGTSSTVGEDRARRLAQVLELTQTISGHMSLPDVFTAVARAAAEMTGADRVVVWVSDDEGLRAVAATSPSPVRPTVPEGAGVTTRSDTTVAPYGFSDEQPSEAVSQAAAYGRTLRSAGGRQQQIVVPMTSGGRVLGAIDLRGREIAEMPDDEVSLVETLAAHGATAIGVAREHGVTESMSMTDSLTHLPNRRQLDHDLGTECERARRYRRSSALIMIDIDGFKNFNDRHGHVAADQILAEFGRLLAEAIRGSDSAYRYGGDEFVILVREASLAAAAELAERLRHLISERFSVLPPDAPITASFGVVGVDQVDPDPATLIRAADEALYSAKERGRNRVVSFR